MEFQDLLPDQIKLYQTQPDGLMCFIKIKTQNKCMCVSGFSFEKVRYGRSKLKFHSIIYMYLMYFWIFLSFFFQYSQTCIKRSPKGRLKSSLLIEVVS